MAGLSKHTEVKPRKTFKISTIDLEATTYNEQTGENKDKVDLIGFYFKEKYIHFNNPNALWDYIKDNIKELHGYICFAHNGGGYDFLFMINCNQEHKNNIKINVTINGRITDFEYFVVKGKKKYKIIFRDSYKVLTSSLARLGRSFGFQKTEMPSWLENEKNGMTFKEHYKMSIEYNKNDCVILYNIINAFLDDETFHYLKSIPLTISSLALRTFKHMYGVKRLCEISNASYNDKYIRKSYSGGRVEVFKTKIDEDYSYLDVNCYSEDTECWTEQGWKKYDELKTGMKVLTYNKDRKEMEYKPIRYLHLYDYEGDMYNFKGENCDMLVTPNHNVTYYGRIGTSWDLKQYQEKQAKDVPQNVLLIGSGKYKEGIQLLSTDLIKLLGWIITEGNYRKGNNGIVISQSDHYNSEYINEIETLLKRLKIPYTKINRGKRGRNYNGYEFHIPAKYGKPLKSLIPDKQIQLEWIINWDKKSLCTLFWTLMKGDGSFRNQKGKATYVSKNNTELDMVQLIATKIGIKSSVNYKHNVVYFKLNRGHLITVNKNKEYYKGKVWCITVSNNIFLVRRNGKVTFLNNSLYPSQMLKPVPVGTTRIFNNRKSATDLFNDGTDGIYEVEWEAPKLHTPILWERKHIGQSTKLIFGINKASSYKGKGYYALPELKLAEENGYKIRPLTCCVAFEKAPVFKEYVEKFTLMKYEGGAKREIAKLLLNSLYGKTGQRLFVDTTSTLSDNEAFAKVSAYRIAVNAYYNSIEKNASSDIIDWWLNKINDSKIECIDKDLRVYNYKSKKDHKDTNVMWASYITSMARCELWKACERCDFEQAYVDTDSCIMPMEYKKKMPIDDKEIGKWKEEGIVHHGRFYAPKSYIVDISTHDKESLFRHTRVVMKGVDNEIIRRFYNKEGFIPSNMYNKIVDIFRPNTEFSTYKITPFKQSRRMNIESGSARLLTKKLSLDYDKRKIIENYNTLPY